MKNLLKYILLALTVAVLMTPAYGATRKRQKDQKGKQATETPKPDRRKESYKKFISAKGTVKYPGIVNLYKDKTNKLWAEIPDSLLGRDFLFDQITKSEGDPTVIDGRNISRNIIYRIERLDSTIVITTSGTTSYPEDAADPGIAKAIRESATRTTAFRIPVKCVGNDSSSYVFNISQVLTPSKANTRLSGLRIGSMTVINGSLDSKKSGRPCPVTFGNSFGVKREASFNCTGAVAMFESKGKFTSTVQTTLTLLPQESDFPLKKADSRIGTFNITRNDFSPTGRNTGEKYISRWDLRGDKYIKVYVDTLFTPVMAQAIREGIVAWNRAFVGAGLGARIIALPFDPDVNVDDPLVSSVRFSGGTETTVTGNMHRGLNGQILSFQICVPRYLCNYARMNGGMLIGDVDDRFRFHREVSEDALAEIARALVMKLTGNALGLANNLAGSRAYTPEQLRSPEFTRLHGITSSVTDDVLFNDFARPGDKERGLTLINDRIGEYDLYAIDWIYGDGQIDDLPEHLYVGEIKGGWQDPRGIRRDLGSDVVAWYGARKSHLMNCIPAMKEWKRTECANDEEGDDLLIDWIFLNNWYAMAALSHQVGGVGTNEMRENGGRPKFEPVPASVQRECTARMLDLVDEMSYIQKDKEFLLMFGANKNVSDYLQINVNAMMMIHSRLPRILAACELGGSGFSAEEFMNMCFESTFRDLRRGQLDEYGDNRIAQYITVLAGMSEVTSVRLKEAISGHKSIAEEREIAEEFRADMSNIPSRYNAEAELIAYNFLQKSSNLLKLARSRFSDEAQLARIDYLTYLADAALGI